jgi:hypothetical protein
MGDLRSAKEMYAKTLELDPEFDAAKRRLKEIEEEVKQGQGKILSPSAQYFLF